MVHLLFFCLASVGLTAILVDGAIFSGLRRYFADEAARIRQRRERKNLPPGFSLFETIHEILNCYQCCGFWAGLFCSPFLLTSGPFWNGMGTKPQLLVNCLFTVLFCGFATSLLSTLYLKGFEYVYSYTILAQRSTPSMAMESQGVPEPEAVADQDIS